MERHDKSGSDREERRADDLAHDLGPGGERAGRVRPGIAGVEAAAALRTSPINRMGKVGIAFPAVHRLPHYGRVAGSTVVVAIAAVVGAAIATAGSGMRPATNSPRT